jgi:TolB-like protein/Flp pilus assembly protein TadD
MHEGTPDPDAPSPAFEAPFVPGYRIVRELGRGGMATVYLAVQESLGRDVALKLLTRRLAEDASAAQRFVREARTAARLVHRHIVGIHDVGEHAGQPYLAMEYLPGDTIAGGALPPTQALEIAREIALALDHAHRQGVVHRDVKPDNILRRADGSCALADFGIARTTDGGGGMTQDGVTLGTPHYMSPEQLQGAELDGRSDLYSLGVVLYQLLTGDVPYKGTDGWAVGMQHISAPLPRLPPGLARYQPVIDALMAKDPARRPQTGADAARLVEAALGQSGSAPTLAMRAPPPRRVKPAALAAGLVALALFAAGGAYLWRIRAPGNGASTGTPVAEAQPVRSIAVLPLVNISGNPANEYFSDGLAETTLDMLARVPDLKVIARTSSFAFKGQTIDVREIGRRLGAANLLSGSVQQAGDQVRISVQLVRASDGTHLWAQTYDRKLSDVFRIQDEVAGEVVRALQVAMPGAQKARMGETRSENIDAYREYLRGIALLPERRADQMREAAVHFEKAVAVDPSYARAYVAAAQAYILLDQYGSINDEEQARIGRYVDRALALAPDLGEAHVMRGGQFERIGKFEDALREYQRGVQLSPGFATGHQWLGELLVFGFGRADEALREFDVASQLDPLSPVVRGVRILALSLVGRLDEALAMANAMIAEAPRVARTYDTRSGLHQQRGDLVAALRDTQAFRRLDPTAYGFQTHRCTILIDFGALPEARACAARLAALAPRQTDVRYLHVRLALLDGKPEVASAVLAKAGLPPVAEIRLMAGDAAGTLAILRQQAPVLFEATPRVAPADSFNALSAAGALAMSGDEARARKLVDATISAMRSRARGGTQFAPPWYDVVGPARVGDIDAALAALEAAVDGGFFLGIAELDADPTLARLRADPRYARIVAPARDRAGKQIAAARAAHLLDAP